MKRYHLRLHTLPELACKSLGISNLRLYVSIQNPFHITNYSGLDPEATMGSPLIQGVDWGSYPNSRNYLIGFKFCILMIYLLNKNNMKN